MAAVFALGDARPRAAWLIAMTFAFVLHGAAAVRAAATLFEIGDYAAGVRAWVTDQLRSRYDIEVEQKEEPKLEPEPPPEPEPEPEPEKQKPVVRAPTPDEPPPPPAAAEAGKVLTADPDPNEPLDLTDKGFISGTSDRFAGGVSASEGTSKTAVRDQAARPEGVPGGTGRAPAPPPAPEQDLSRPPLPVNLGTWNCGFPPEADTEQIDFAVVVLVVTVATDGRAQSVTVTSDPGHGFGRLARQCAMRMRYNVGQDRAGRPVARSTPPIKVRFTR